MLNEYNFKYIYSSGTGNSPIEFFNNALARSSYFDIGLGFFSSASMNVLSYGFAKFISNGGKMRLYINQYISDEDFEAFITKPEKIEDKVISDFLSMYGILSKRDKHFFNCLSFLISSGRIDIRILIPKTGGIAHQKFGVFTDAAGNKLSFIGSLNLTASALTSKNIESISCQASWRDGQDCVAEYQKLFDDYFGGLVEDVSVIEATNLSREIVKAFPAKDVKEIMKEEEELIKEWDVQEKKNTDNTSNLPMSTDTPHFPYPTGAFPYQIEAYRRWCENDFTGIFAMATGTGKTITSLNCVLEEYTKTGKYKILILVPSNDLVRQWVEELGKFNYKNILIVNGENDWRKSVTELINDALWGIDRNFVIISTYKSFTDDSLQKKIKKLNCDDLILIADEAHNVGSPMVQAAFSTLPIKKRIALSATPNRRYDEDGTKAIEAFFHDEPPYCYSFPMERAIKEGRLMHYLYYPRIAYLNDEEMKRYIYYTKKLMAFFDPGKQRLKENQEVKDLLMKRKRVIHKAQGKYSVFMNIIDELVSINKTKYCFVYVPEGMDYSSGEEKHILEKMQGLLYDKYPQIHTSSFLGGDSEKEDKLRAFAEGKIDMLFAMKCLDEGVDVPRAEVGIFTSSTGNPRQFIQRRGRLLRKHPEKNYSYIYDTVVVPDFNYYPDSGTYEMERSLVKNELMRVAYFASLSDNYYDSKTVLQKVLAYYNIEISCLISELQTQ